MPKRSEAKKAKTTVMTIRLKVKSSMMAFLNRASIEVNQVWNWANATSYQGIMGYTGRRYLSAFDLNNFSVGSTKSAENKNGFRFINSDTMQLVNQEYVTRRTQFKKPKLNWRKSFGSGKSLGWVPFKDSSFSIKHFKANKKGRKEQNAFRFRGKTVRVFNVEYYQEILGIPTAETCGGCFAQDSLGNWYMNIQVCMEPEAHQAYLEKMRDIPRVAPKEVLGIDLGLKSTATTSDPDMNLEGGKFYKNYEKKIASAQSHGHKKQAKFLNKKVKNCRQNEIHQQSHLIISTYQVIKIGDLKISNLALKGHKKSGLDNAIGGLKALLLYKGHWAGRSVSVVNEKYTTQACSNIDCRDPETGAFHLTGPVGKTGLAVRIWTCVLCGKEHHRDTSSAVCMTYVPLDGILPVVSRKETQTRVRAKAIASVGCTLTTSVGSEFSQERRSKA